MTASGQKRQLPSLRLSARYRISQATFDGTDDYGRAAPKPDLPATAFRVPHPNLSVGGIGTLSPWGTESSAGQVACGWQPTAGTLFIYALVSISASSWDQRCPSLTRLQHHG